MNELLENIPAAHLEYGLRQGVVGDWLVLGPLATPFAEMQQASTESDRRQVLRYHLGSVEQITQVPSEQAPCTVTVGGVTQQALWRVANTLEDGCVDFAQHVTTPHLLCGWAYAQIVSPRKMAISLVLQTAGPAQVQINGEIVLNDAEALDRPARVRFAATLDQGVNEVMVHVATAGQGNLPLMLRLCLVGIDAGTVALPTLLEPAARRQKVASVMELAYLAQDVYAGEQRIVLRWPADMQWVDALTVRLQTPSGRIYGEANPLVQKSAKVDFGEAAEFPDGHYEVLLQPQFKEYYVRNLRVQRRLPLQIRNGKWSTVYYGTQDERRREALEDAAKRTDNIFAEIAKSALGQWDALNHEVIERTLDQVVQKQSGYERSILALLGWVARRQSLPGFPQEIAWAMEEQTPALLGDLVADSGIVAATCHLLAAQFHPQQRFADSQTGAWHQAHAESVALSWLQGTAQMGLPQGESAEAYADAFIALSHLVDLAHSDEIAELATVVMDKLAYQVALQSFLGVWSGSQDQTYLQGYLSGRLGPLSGVARTWWGQGAYQDDCAATVSVACAESYVLPEIIAVIGVDRQQESWLRRQDLRSHLPQPRVNRGVYRTGDYLLTSAQGDWAAGTSALLWQVTLGPDTIVIGNRPARSSDHAAWQPSYWRGSAAPVRLAQWQDVLVVAYGAAEDALLVFSHAYFPKALFDEVYLANGWVMARKGNGYVALTATGGVELVTQGRTAQREVRGAGHAIWLVQMGRAARDGTFSQFVEKVLAQPLMLETDRLRYGSLAGQTLCFDANAPLAESFKVDGTAQPLEDFPHLQSVYGGTAELPARQVEIAYQEHLLRLDLGVRESPATT